MVSAEPYLLPDFGGGLKTTSGLTISRGLRKRESTSVRVNHAEPGLQEGLKGILAGHYVKPVGHLIRYFGKPAFRDSQLRSGRRVLERFACSLGTSRGHPQQRRDLEREVFDEITSRDGRLVAVAPRPEYRSVFACSIWNQDHESGGERSSWVEQTPPASILASGIGVLLISTWLGRISRVA